MGVVWFAAVSYQRLGGDLDKLAARQEARERAATEAVSQAPAASVPTPVPAVVLPVAEPVNNPAAPAAPVVPMDETERTAAAALASVNITAPMAHPVLPIPGDGSAVRQVLQPMAKHPVAVLRADHLDVSEPQKVVNNGQRRE